MRNKSIKSKCRLFPAPLSGAFSAPRDSWNMCWLPVLTQWKQLSPAERRRASDNTQAPTRPCSLTLARTNPYAHVRAYKVCLRLFYASPQVLWGLWGGLCLCVVMILSLSKPGGGNRSGNIFTIESAWIPDGLGLSFDRKTSWGDFHSDGCMPEGPNITVLSFPCSSPLKWLAACTSPCFMTDKMPLASLIW